MALPSAYKRNFGYKFSHFGSDTAGHDIKAFGDTTGKYILWDASADTFSVVGTMTITGAPTITGNSQFTGTVTVGVDDTGYDVKLFGATSGKYWLWDESADKMILVGDSQFTGAITVGVDDTGHDVKLFGATSGAYCLWDESADSLLLVGGALLNVQGTVTVGVDDTGYDVKFFGATSGSYMLWDESADKLIVNAGTADLGTSCEADAYTVGGVAGADFNGAVTNLTVVKGIVTAAS